MSELLDLVHEIQDLNHASALLGWDQDTHMPEGGGDSRARVLATLAKNAHNKLTNPRLGELASLASESKETLLRDVGRYWKQAHEDAVRLPSSLVAKLTEVTALSQNAWQVATTFDEMKGHLNEVVNLQFEVAAHYPEFSAYDSVIEDFDRGVSQAYLDKVFAKLKPALLDLRSRVPGSTSYHKTECNDAGGLMDLCQRVTEAIGYDYGRGNMAVTRHPFMATVGAGDARIAISLDPSDPLGSLMGAIHEAGHAMLEQGVGYEGTGLEVVQSMGIHESQSLFWETLIGKSPEFWEEWLPELNKILTNPYPDVKTVVADLHRYNPSNVIRLQAGDLDYGLHILLRYDLERALFSKEITPFEMRDKFNELCLEYFGALPKDDRKEGVLQDVHWAAGYFGYFPSYLLGASLAAQLKAIAPDHRYLEFLRGTIHSHGGRYTFEELTTKYLGGYDPDHYIKHLKDVYL